MAAGSRVSCARRKSRCALPFRPVLTKVSAMASATDDPTRGKVLSEKDGMLVFNPRGTTYELHLKHTGEAPPLDMLLDALVRATARKVWTVPSGGNFITPIIGTPRIVQGRVKFLSDQQLVVRAGANFVIDLPRA